MKVIERGLHVDEVKELFYIDDEGELRWKVQRKNGVKAGASVGNLRPVGYKATSVNKVSFLCHRLVWVLHYGEWPNGQIDHINGDRKDNRVGNLRVVTARENLKNQKRYKNNTSRVTGVYWRGDRCKWQSIIKTDYKYLCLGTFEDFFEAVCARKSAELKHGYHVNHGRS